MVKEQALRVEGDQVGQRLDAFLASQLAGHSRGYWQEAIARGEVIVGNKVVSPSLRLEEGQSVRVLPRVSVPIVGKTSLDIPVIYQDNDVIVINKPAGVSVHPGDVPSAEITVSEVFADSIEQDGTVRAGIVHRLDKDTSGVMVLARTLAAMQTLQDQFRLRQVDKYYTALVWGHMKQSKARIELPLARHHNSPTKMAVSPDGKAAVSEYSVEYEYEVCSLLSVRLLTGRMHQIRVHLSYLGNPVVGDTVYGSKPLPTGLTRQFLHAAQLGITLPSGKKRVFEADLSPDLASYLLTITHHV